MPNWFETLNAALEAENLVHLWPLGLNIAYGQTAATTVELAPPEGRKRGKYHHISIYRDEFGRYERPVHYDC